MPHCLLSATKNIYQSVTADEMQFCSFLCWLLAAIAVQVTKDISGSLGLFLLFGCGSVFFLEALCPLVLPFGDPKIICFRGALTST